MERGGSGNGAGARAAACLGGDPGDGDFVQMGADVETAWMRLGVRVSTAGVGGYRVFFFLQQLSTPTWRRAGVRRRRTATGAAYAGGRTTSRADVRRRVGIPIPNVKLPYYPLYVLGGCTEALPYEKYTATPQ